MANPHKGQVAFQVGEATYTMEFSINALCNLEDAMGKPIDEIMAGLNSQKSVRLKTIRSLVWAGLSENHKGITEHQAGEILGLATPAVALAQVVKALALAFPAGDESKSQGDQSPN